MDTIILILTCTILLHGTWVLSENQSASGSSDETIRRYLALYEQQRQQEQEQEQGRSKSWSDPVPHKESSGSTKDGSSSGVYSGQQQPTPNFSHWKGQGQPEYADVVNRYSEPELDDPFLNQVNPSQNRQREGTPEPTWISLKQDSKPENKQEHNSKKSEQLTSTSGSTKSSPNDQLPFSQALSDTQSKDKNPLDDIYFVVIVAGCSAAAIFGVIAAGFCFYRFQRNSKAAAEVDYPAYGVTGPNKDQTSPKGDRKLAQSAQMYHYQHQKQQMIAVEKANKVRNPSASDMDSEEENEYGDYTVYECPGLAPTGEMEVKNPLFQDDSTPMSPPVVSKDVTKP